jgi:hypothetical protein
MTQISPNELLAQLKSFAANPPLSLTENSDLRTQLYHATQEAMLSFESAPDPINRVAVAHVSLSSSLVLCKSKRKLPKTQSLLY